MQAPSREHRSDLALALGCALLAVVTYLPAIAASFQFDDWGVIVADTRVQSLAAWAASMPGVRPLLKLTYALNHELGASPVGFRGFNIAVHALNTAIVYTLLHGLGTKQGRDTASARLAALVGALLFALLPVQTEAVTYLSGRSTALAATFALASLLFWVRSLEPPRPRSLRLLSAALFALALGVKETVIVLPLALLLWRTVARSAEPTPSSLPRARRARAALAETALHFALAGLAIVLALAWPPYRRLLDVSVQARGIGINLLTQADAVLWLAGQMLCLAPINPDPMLPVAGALSGASWLRAALILATVVAAFWQLRRKPALAFGLLWFFLWLLPTNSLLPRLDVANDRQLYLALIGPAWLAGLALARLAGRGDGLAARWQAIAAAVVLAALVGGAAFATLRQNRIYASEVTFWEAVARRTPANARAANNLGFAYALACRAPDAAREFERAARLDPSGVRARVNARLLREGALPAGAAQGECARPVPN